MCIRDRSLGGAADQPAGGAHQHSAWHCAGYSDDFQKQDHQGDPADLSGDHPYYAPAGSSVPVLF